MNPKEDCLYLMDLLDLDEEVIDARLKSIMVRETFTPKHLKSAIHMLLYKQMINTQEGSDCENDIEFDFVVKLIRNVDAENIAYVCSITNIVLSLNITTLVSKSEHLLQQILSNIEAPAGHHIENESVNNVLYFRICDSILDAVIDNGQKLSLLFLEIPIENVIFCAAESKIHFINSTVPRLFKCVIGYNILDKIWSLLTQLESRDMSISLQVLICLSDLYLPIETKIESDIVLKSEFWKMVLNGLSYEEFSLRKQAVYLAKRAVDYVVNLKRNVHVKDDIHTLLNWEHKSAKELRQDWDNFFILMDSLEEKQSNIVLPSLQLFNSVQNVGSCWLDCAFKLGLKHDNVQVRMKCIGQRLKIKLGNKSQALLLLEALNDIHLYDIPSLFENIKGQLIETLKDNYVLEYIVESLPLVNWSPVPLYYISNVLSNLDKTLLLEHMNQSQFIDIIIDTLKVPCNDVVMRKAIHTNILHFAISFTNILQWKEYAKMLAYFKVDSEIIKSNCQKIIPSNNVDKTELLNFITSSYAYINFGLLCLYTQDNEKIWTDIVMQKVKKIEDMHNRQYSNKAECLNDLIFLLKLYDMTVNSFNSTEVLLHSMIAGYYKLVIRCIYSLLIDEYSATIDETDLIFNGFNVMSETIKDDKNKVELLELYKSAIIVLNKDGNINKKALSVFVLNSLNKSCVLNKNYKHEMLDLKRLLNLINVEFKESDNNTSTGRYTNLLYEKCCELTNNLLEESDQNISELIDYIENVTECGGYGCLKWILKIMNKILPTLLKEDNEKLNIVQFINRLWKEIEELKSNSQYPICMEEFVKLITHDAILNDPTYNNLVLSYCNKIIEYGHVKNTPLVYLVKELNGKELNIDNGHVIYIIGEILLFSPVSRKDQRIFENTVVEILSKPKYALEQQSFNINFNYQVQYMAVSILAKIKDPEILSTISSLMSQRLDEVLGNKQRYHGNSQLHRSMLVVLQHLLLILLIRPVPDDGLVEWSLKLLGRLPHQPSVRVCLEWYIALAMFFKNKEINADTLDKLKSYNIPITSQLIIIYWILKHKITEKTHNLKEYEFVMNALLTHTMGQMFNIRLQAQYLATKLYKMVENKPEKYSFTIDIIERNFQESCKDKNFIKLQDCYFANSFDIIENLTPYFIYYVLQKSFDLYNENVDIKYLRDVVENIDKSIGSGFSKKVSSENMFEYFVKNNESRIVIENEEAIGNIQKKHIPWKIMSDIGVSENEKLRETASELILVASLVDKLPNLGGMARTSEVFGVHTYVVDSLRHLQDKQFQSLSVSAERWVNIEEVRPGPPLKEYLMMKKTEGYSILAAEQTSNSVKLQSFKFPKKSLLLLGHEKEGIPCDLLPLMDHCVEIPQQGFVRSLNVHVTAAIFVWEYSRQNLL